jgi:hypothetical protein
MRNLIYTLYNQRKRLGKAAYEKSDIHYVIRENVWEKLHIFEITNID